MPSDNNRPNRTDYSRETEQDEKKGRFCLQITTALVGLTTQERQNLVKNIGRFCLQITTAQIGLTTQERQQLKKGKVLPSDKNSPNRTDYQREIEPGEPGDKTRRKKDKKYWFIPH